jgi:hypothetical protein
MKVRERKKVITEHNPKRELVDGIFTLLKSRQQIPNDFSVSYERVCSVLSDHRMHLYSNKAHQVIVGSEGTGYSSQRILVFTTRRRQRKNGCRVFRYAKSQ